MQTSEVKQFNELYEVHQKNLKLQGKAKTTINSYSMAVRRVYAYFNCSLDKLTPEQLQDYFFELVETHSWSTIKIDRNGLQFFWKFVLKKEWEWVNIVCPPKVKTIPDILL